MKDIVREVRKVIGKVLPYRDLLKKHFPETYHKFIEIAGRYSSHHFYRTEKWKGEKDLEVIYSILHQLEELGIYDGHQ